METPNHTIDYESFRRISQNGPGWRWTIAALAVTLGLATTACGSGTDSDSAAGDDPTTTAEVAPTTTEAPTTTAAPAPTTVPPTTVPEPAASAVVIDVVVDLNSVVGTGTFDVPEGGDALGCTDGRFYLSTEDPTLAFMTCENGSNTGEFKLSLDPTQVEEDHFVGAWTIVSGTGDFETLTGGGEFDDLRDTALGSIIGTRTGEIQFTATGE